MTTARVLTEKEKEALSALKVFGYSIMTGTDELSASLKKSFFAYAYINQNGESVDFLEAILDGEKTPEYIARNRTEAEDAVTVVVDESTGKKTNVKIVTNPGRDKTMTQVNISGEMNDSIARAIVRGNSGGLPVSVADLIPAIGEVTVLLEKDVVPRFVNGLHQGKILKFYNVLALVKELKENGEAKDIGMREIEEGMRKILPAFQAPLDLYYLSALLKKKQLHDFAPGASPSLSEKENAELVVLQGKQDALERAVVELDNQIKECYAAITKKIKANIATLSLSVISISSVIGILSAIQNNKNIQKMRDFNMILSRVEECRERYNKPKPNEVSYFGSIVDRMRAMLPLFLDETLSKEGQITLEKNVAKLYEDIMVEARKLPLEDNGEKREQLMNGIRAVLPQGQSYQAISELKSSLGSQAIVTKTNVANMEKFMDFMANQPRLGWFAGKTGGLGALDQLDTFNKKVQSIHKKLIALIKEFDKSQAVMPNSAGNLTEEDKKRQGLANAFNKRFAEKEKEYLGVLAQEMQKYLSVPEPTGVYFFKQARALLSNCIPADIMKTASNKAEVEHKDVDRLGSFKSRLHIRTTAAAGTSSRAKSPPPSRSPLSEGGATRSGLFTRGDDSGRPKEPLSARSYGHSGDTSPSHRDIRDIFNIGQGKDSISNSSSPSSPRQKIGLFDKKDNNVDTGGLGPEPKRTNKKG